MLIILLMGSLALILVVLCAAIGVISIIVVIDDHRSSRSRNLADQSPNRGEVTTRRILGVGARGDEGDQ